MNEDDQWRWWWMKMVMMIMINMVMMMIKEDGDNDNPICAGNVYDVGSNCDNYQRDVHNENKINLTTTLYPTLQYTVEPRYKEVRYNKTLL